MLNSEPNIIFKSISLSLRILHMTTGLVPFAPKVSKASILPTQIVVCIGYSHTHMQFIVMTLSNVLWDHQLYDNCLHVTSQRGGGGTYREILRIHVDHLLSITHYILQTYSCNLSMS